MFLNSFKLSESFIKPFLTHQCRINLDSQYYIAKRWAGHNKWSKVKHVKAEKSKEKSGVYTRILKNISLAVKQGGDNPELNYKLKSILEEGKKLSIPNATMERAISVAKKTAGTKPNWFVYQNAAGILVGFELCIANIASLRSTLNQHVKKFGLKLVSKAENLYVEKGIIISESMKNVQNALDKATEDAIEAGALEVSLGEDETIIFECEPNHLDGVLKKLENQGYNIQSANVELEFSNYVPYNEDKIESINKMIEKIEASSVDLLRHNHNIKEE